jgi:hypothetical protein
MIRFHQRAAERAIKISKAKSSFVKVPGRTVAGAEVPAQPMFALASLNRGLFSGCLSVHSGRAKGERVPPFYFQYIAHRGACGQTGIVP